MNIKESYQLLQARIKNFYEVNKKHVQIVGLATLAIVGGMIYWFNFYMPSQEKEASVKFAKMYHYFKTDSFVCRAERK